MKKKLFDYFIETKKHAAPRSTQLVRRMTQREEEAEATLVYEVRYGDSKLFGFPTHWNKTSFYKQYCNLNGWHPLYDSNHRLLRMKSIDGAEGEGTVVASQRTFNRYWSKHFPKLVTQQAREDICGDCFAFANKERTLNHHFGGRVHGVSENDINLGSRDDEGEATDGLQVTFVNKTNFQLTL